MTPGRRFAIVAIVLVLVVAWARSWFDAEPDPGETVSSRPRSNVIEFLTDEAGSEWAEVTRGRALEFPRDHGAHPDYRQEWWYYTGNLRTPGGRRFGVQLTFFRFGHGAFDAYRESAWRNEHSWMAHFAVSDVESGVLHAWQDYARGALSLAGATAAPFRVWVNGWSVGQDDVEHDGFDATLEAAAGDTRLRLALQGSAPPLLQGEAGYSAKDAREETASYYYSLPNLEASGTLEFDGERFEVSGRAWMDREWSTEVLSKEQRGWDWFALRLAGSGTLMLFQVRGDADAHFRYAVHVGADGRARYYGNEAIELSPTAWWRSEATGSRYPVAWQLSIEPADIDLAVAAAFRNQELTLDFSYWEGVVDVEGSVDNERVRGEGYMELTGY